MKKGQILVITLLVLTILSIVTVSLVILNTRDVGQIVNSEIYDKVYNSSETKLKEIVGVVGDPTVSLSQLTSKYNTCTNLGGTILTYECSYSLQSDSDPDINYSDTIKVSNEKDIVDYQLEKDRPLTLNMAGYTNNLTITLSKASAVEFTAVYDEGGGVYGSFSDVYDPVGTYSSTNSSTRSYYTNPVPSNTNYFVFNTPSGYNYKLLSITPRLKDPGDSLLITIKPFDYSTYPVQIRKFESNAYENGNINSPTVKIITQIPINPQTNGLLNYSLLTPDKVKVSN